MTSPLHPATLSLLAKAAYDNGFDVERAGSGGWLAFASTRSPMWLWLGGAGDQGLDAAFDRGLMTVADDGTVAVSGLPGPGERRLLGIDGLLRARGLEDAHRSYLAWHRERVFRQGRRSPPMAAGEIGLRK